jgi:hypothetical protein
MCHAGIRGRQKNDVVLAYTKLNTFREHKSAASPIQPAALPQKVGDDNGLKVYARKKQGL